MVPPQSAGESIAVPKGHGPSSKPTSKVKLVARDDLLVEVVPNPCVTDGGVPPPRQEATRRGIQAASQGQAWMKKGRQKKRSKRGGQQK